MQTPPPSPLKRAVIIFWSKNFAMFWNEWKISFLVYGRSKFLESSESYFFVWKDAQCSQTDFLVIEFFLRFLIFEIWSFLYWTLVVNWGLRRTGRFVWVPKISEKNYMPGRLHPCNIIFFLYRRPMYYEYWVENCPYLIN